jgi:hypothetical protein
MRQLGLDDHSEWCGYIIKRKRDFPCGGNNRVGYVVTKGGCNVMPGATWFETVPGAHKGIAALELAKRIAPRPDGDGCEGHVFWMLIELSHRQSILPVAEQLDSEPVSLRNLLDAVQVDCALNALRKAAAGFAVIANNTNESQVRSFATESFRACKDAERQITKN